MARLTRGDGIMKTGCLCALVHRDAQDFDCLKAIAATLNLDIAALKEIGSPKALTRIFPDTEYDLKVSPLYKDGDENRPAALCDI